MGLVITALLVAAPALAETRSHDGLCDGILRAAGLGVASGKVVLVQRGGDGRMRPLGGKLGDARVMPAFDVKLRSASVVMRVEF